MSLNRQASLFDEPSGDARLTLTERLAGAPRPANKNQAKLQTLIQQIEQQRAILQEWRDFEPDYRQTVQRDLVPLEDEYLACQRAMIVAIDKALKTRGMLTGKVQRRQAGEIIVDLCLSVLAEQADPEIEALHDAYSDLPHADGKNLESALKQDMLATIFGIQIEDGADDAAIMAAVQAHQAKLQAEREAADTQPGKSRPTPSKRAQAAEKLAEDASLSVRQVYRKLASALHPDRESDTAERERKTALMQRVNDAYGKNDLLSLLSLQYEIEQIDTEHLAQLDDMRQKHYIHLFTEQLNGLKQEIRDITLPFSEMLRNYRPTLRPVHVMQALNIDIAQLKAEVSKMKQDVSDCQNKEKLKRWIKANYQPADEWDPIF